MPKLTQGNMNRIPIVTPPLKEQQAIAGILGTLDDKIELNRRRSRTLEAMARAIFQSWFVDFDPVHAKAAGQQPASLSADIAKLFPDQFEDSEFGSIPRGWTIDTLGSIATDVRDAIDATDIPPGTPYIALEHMSRRCISLDTWEAADSVASGKLRFAVDDILFGKLRPYFQKVGPAPVHGVCSTDILVARRKQPHWYGIVLGHMISDAFVAHTDRGSTGTKMPRTNWRDMSAYKIAKPPEPISDAFTATAKSITAAIRTNNAESRTLAALRDALLPKIISGELRVQDAIHFLGSN